MTQVEIDGAVQEAVVGALGVDEDEVTPEATLMGELGAESIDLLDILFRLERSLGVKIQAADLGARAGRHPGRGVRRHRQDHAPRDSAQLKNVMPQIDTGALPGSWRPRR